MIPPFRADGTLPPGEHGATWEEIDGRFGGTERRRELLAGLKNMLNALRQAGCRRAWIDGSFVMDKPEPGDFDGCWDVTGADWALVNPVLLDFGPGRLAQKQRFGGEMFFSDARADALGTPFVEFFQRDRDGRPKGLIVIDL